MFLSSPFRQAPLWPRLAGIAAAAALALWGAGNGGDQTGATPHPAGYAGHLLPQGEKDSRRESSTKGDARPLSPCGRGPTRAARPERGEGSSDPSAPSKIPIRLAAHVGALVLDRIARAAVVLAHLDAIARRGRRAAQGGELGGGRISGQGGGQERMLQAEARRRRVEGGVWSAASSFRNINFCESFVVVTGIEGCHGLILRPNQLGRHNKTRYSTLIRWGPRDSHISFK